MKRSDKNGFMRYTYIQVVIEHISYMFYKLYQKQKK